MRKNILRQKLSAAAHTVQLMVPVQQTNHNEFRNITEPGKTGPHSFQSANRIEIHVLEEGDRQKAAQWLYSCFRKLITKSS